MTTEDARKLFVAGLPDSINEEVLRQLFEATGGTVLEVSLPKDRATGRARGFGFVTLETPEQADKARASLDGSFQAGRAISVRPFQGGTARKEGGRPIDAPPMNANTSGPAEDRTLYVGNLPYDATADEVEKLLTSCGVSPVLRVHLPVGPDGRPRGFGFVTLSSPDAVQQSLGALANADVRGRRVMVKVAHPRGSTQMAAARPMGGGAPRMPMRSASEPPSGRYEGVRNEPGQDPNFRPPTPTGEFEEDEEGVRAGAGKAGKDKKRKGAAAASKRKSGGADDDRRRGGAASWQRWEDWDED
jgi:nucleolin